MPHPPQLNPDIANRMRVQSHFAAEFFGQDVTWRKYISASAGNPEFGIGDTWCYQERPQRVNLRQLKPEEVQAIGGQFTQGGFDIYITEQPNLRDEMTYLGKKYKVATEPIPEQIGVTLYWQCIALRADVTGTW